LRTTTTVVAGTVLVLGLTCSTIVAKSDSSHIPAHQSVEDAGRCSALVAGMGELESGCRWLTTVLQRVQQTPLIEGERTSRLNIHNEFALT
jgi:hypothetical protein